MKKKNTPSTVGGGETYKNYTPYLWIGGMFIIVILIILLIWKNKDNKDVSSLPSSSPNISKESNEKIRGLIDNIISQQNMISELTNQKFLTYGKIENFYVRSKVSLPSGFTKIGERNEITSILDIMKNIPPETNLFSYDPKKSKVEYYKADNAYNISTLSEGTLVIGSTLL